MYVCIGLACVQLSLSSLEKALHAYTLGPASQPFDMKAVPVAPVEEETRAKVSQHYLVPILNISYAGSKGFFGKN